MSQLSIVHWNDVYRISPQKVSPNGDTVDVTQFAAVLDDIRRKWAVRPDGARDGISLFSGDLFSPSLEGTVTRGSHMVPVINELAPDAAVAGNHEFDFGYPHLTDLIDDTKFPWMLSNIVDETTNDIPKHLHTRQILERSGVRVGIIGLVEEDWVTTVSQWPANFKFKDMAEVGRELSQQLRGEHQCDLIIALTHARIPSDIQLAKDLLALSPSAQDSHSIAGEHGVDIILGGHDHVYFISKGVTAWEGFDVSKPSMGAEGDKGDILVVKSGTDFRELSELTLELADTPPGSIRKKIIKAVHGTRHEIKPGMPSSENLKNITHNVLSSVSESLVKPACITEVDLDLRSQFLRTEETAAGNWFADVLRHAYDDALCTKYGSGSDGVLLSAGSLRGDSLYPTGIITLGNIMEILPFDDPAVVLELDGESLWDALEGALSKYPAQEGRFPIVSGFRVSWDSRRPAGQRVLEVWHLKEVPSTAQPPQSSGTGTPAVIDGEVVKREKNGQTYKVVVRDFMATGHDGYTSLPGHQYLIDHEHAQLQSVLLRKYLLGAQYINKTVRLGEKKQDVDHIHPETANVVKRAIEHTKVAHKGGALPKVATALHHKLRSRAHYQDHYNVSAREHMSGVDVYDGKKIRRGGTAADNGGADNGDNGQEEISKEDLLVIHPVVDGRLKDEARN